MHRTVLEAWTKLKRGLIRYIPSTWLACQRVRWEPLEPLRSWTGCPLVGVMFVLASCSLVTHIPFVPPGLVYHPWLPTAYPWAAFIRRFAAGHRDAFRVVFVEETDYDSEIPCRGAATTSEHGVLRLRLPSRFALRQTLLRMTEDGRDRHHRRAPAFDLIRTPNATARANQRIAQTSAAREK